MDTLHTVIKLKVEVFLKGYVYANMIQPDQTVTNVYHFTTTLHGEEPLKMIHLPASVSRSYLMQ